MLEPPRRRPNTLPEWKYVNVRRPFVFIEESVDKGMQWVVFEPNDEPLWASCVAFGETECSEPRRDRLVSVIATGDGWLECRATATIRQRVSRYGESWWAGPGSTVLTS